jgi:4-hydroxybenzoate polyprenyltransferase
MENSTDTFTKILLIIATILKWLAVTIQFIATIYFFFITENKTVPGFILGFVFIMLIWAGIQWIINIREDRKSNLKNL